MKRKIFPIVLTLLLALLVSCENKKSEQNILKDTTNWLLNKQSTLTDSVLTLQGGKALANYKDEYKNFELTLDCKTSNGAIGGIWLHTNQSNTTPNKGYEVLINNNIENNEWRKTGSLSAVRNFGKRTAENGNWFPIKIRVTGKQIKVYVNNVWIVDYTEPHNPYRTSEYEKRLFNAGLFSFLTYEGNIEFKKINIKGLAHDLKSDNPNEDIDEQTDDIIRLQQQNYPLIDSHLHLKDWTKEEAATLSRKLGITYGIAPNCGLKFPITADKDIRNYVDSMKHQPFYLAMQAEGREWLTLFSEEAMQDFDYRFTDALTWTDNKGRRQRMWVPEETFIDNEQQYMDMVVDRACTIISTEPFNIFVNPTFLPDDLMPKYEELWTVARMQRIINECIKHNIAFEINNRYKIPSARLIKQAKASGIKFTFGTNNGSSMDVGKMEYAIEMIKECNIKPSDLYIPLSKNL